MYFSEIKGKLNTSDESYFCTSAVQETRSTHVIWLGWPSTLRKSSVLSQTKE